MSYTEWVGYAAASRTTASFVPQAWLTFKTRNARGISLGMSERLLYALCVEHNACAND